ncbi:MULTISPECIES: GT4 family glycosyltransferase PelF [unclassified Paenibacillus]|uniref:GT4 family glycosyltransferase PelF n=1 Tax=unclassified Paenibacillus TaxID=185978 RepID=UPI00070DD899|nr:MULTISPECIES: GT4 family glycosyltransferase PelF [unclassified Paenibacillus]KQX66377.1 glycosyl transferase [Paenibacillus sp. Root444D2]KRE40960.1 glycosyl transferase [Paenibacillus sp. Soil724D2]
MRICILAEGSYPYITGGVSSWIHSLITNMPEHEFILYVIGAEEKSRGKFKYALPHNVIEIRETFLDTFLNEEEIWGKRYKISKSERETLYSFLAGEKIDWGNLFNFLLSDRINSVSEFLTSKDFFDIMYEVCNLRYSQTPFTEMYWTMRSMVLPLFLTIRNPMPEADLYHSVATGYAGVLGSLGKHLYNKPFLLTEHGIYTREREEEIIKADWVKGYFKDVWIEYFYNLSNCAYSYTDKVISLFNRNKEIQEELGCDGNKITIIPNGVQSSDYDSLQQKENDTEISIGAVVRIVPIKDIKTMIQSFALVKHTISNAKFYIFGPIDEDEEYYEECQQLVQELGTEDIIFTGSINVREYIGKMDILVLTSISEGQPLAVLEGLAASKPFVTTDVGSCRELLYGNQDDFGPAGIVEPVMHYEKLGLAIISLCQNKQLREQMGLNGKRRVSAIYSRDRFIEGYRNIYNDYERSLYGRDRV